MTVIRFTQAGSYSFRHAPGNLIDRAATAAMNSDAGELCNMNDIGEHSVPRRTVFDFDSIALRDMGPVEKTLLRFGGRVEFVTSAG